MLVLNGVVCRVWLYVWVVHYVYVYMVEEKELGVFWVWKPIRSAYGIRTKVESKD